jgi:protein-disulfide isomerase
MTEETEKKKSETITIKKDDLWKYSTIVLAAVVILGLVFGFPGSGSTDANVVADNSPPSNGANNGITGAAKYKIYADDMNLDASDFEECLDSGKYGQATQDDMQYGASIGVQGTPAFFINGKLLSGAQPFAAFQTMIEAELDGSAEAGIDVELGDSYFKGDADAPVTIVEFSDYECSFCARFAEQTLPSIVSNYIDNGKVKLHYRDFPLGFHQNAQKAAEAARCAGELGGSEAYFEMHDKIFAEGV